jgi:hypothetical protein
MLRVGWANFEISEAKAGVNVPPLHPNCRCEIEIMPMELKDVDIDTPPEIPRSDISPIDISVAIIAQITSGQTDSSGRHPTIADMSSIWYEDPFNWIEINQCPWFVVGRIGEIFGVRVTFGGAGRGHGGLWAQNAEEKAYIWKDGEKTDEYKTVHRELSWENIVPQSAASFGNPAPWGHVVFIEAIEVINGEKWVYYSDDWKSGGNRGKVSKKLLSDFIGLCPDTGVIKGHPAHGEFRGYVQII